MQLDTGRNKVIGIADVLECSGLRSLLRQASKAATGTHRDRSGVGSEYPHLHVEESNLRLVDGHGQNRVGEDKGLVSVHLTRGSRS